MSFLISTDLRNACGIYIINSDVDSRSYIGSTRCFWTRFRRHRSALNRGTAGSYRLQQFVNQHGIGSLAFQMLEVCEPEVLVKREQHFLDLYRSYLPKLGFNICHFAESTHGSKLTDKQLSKHRELRQGMRNGRTSLSDEDVLAIRGLYWTCTPAQIAEMYGLTRSSVSAIIRGKSWSHLPVDGYCGRNSESVISPRRQRGAEHNSARLTAADVLLMRSL